MIVLIDNYDSFTYNLVQKLGEVGGPALKMEVFRNDKITVAQIEDLKPTHIVISPGPCTPREGGVSNDIIKHFGPKLPVLGVCLGHQCIGFTAGAIVERAAKLMHGKTDQIHHDGRAIAPQLGDKSAGRHRHSPFPVIRLAAKLTTSSRQRLTTELNRPTAVAMLKSALIRPVL